MPYLNHEDIDLHPLQHSEIPEAFKKSCSYDKNKKYYRLENELRYQHPETGFIYVIPAGNITDGASIPRWLWTLVGSPFSGNYIEAAIIHDWLYHCAIDLCHSIGTRAEADRIFYLAMREYDVGELEAQTKFKAVRMFGPRWK